jgi:hypothetical protein
MPKRHRQPEPIDIRSAAHHSQHSASTSTTSTFTTLATTSNVSSSLKSCNGRPTAAAADKPVFSPGEQKLVEAARKRAMDFPATPETLVRHRKQQEADAKRRRISYDHDSQPVSKVGAFVSAGCRRGTGVDALERFNGGTDTEEEVEEQEDASDLSSNDYVGDDGNQPSTESEPDSEEEDDESELRGLRKAVEAAAAQRRHTGGEEGSSGSSEEEGSDTTGKDSGDDSDGGFDSDDNNGDEEEEDGGGTSGSDGSMDFDYDDRSEGSETGAAQHNSDDEAEEDGFDEGGLITVDFGVFDMEKSHVDGLIHLMDQLCPDKMNEVDRDDLGLALYESPFTSVVRLQNNGEDTTGEEESEFYGLSSVLDVAHGQQLYPKALRPLCELLQQHIWRQAASGIPPTEILTSVVDDDHVSTSRAKCLLLISEYIRNIPLELTVQIFEDLLNRLDAAWRDGGKEKSKSAATHDDPIYATQASMFAVLAKVQRATDAPVTLPNGNNKAPQQQGGGADASGVAEETVANQQSSSPSAAVKKHHHGKKNEKNARTSTGGAMGAPETLLDLKHYIFWREEDNILYEFRDKRVAALVYRCRPQYDGQPEHEIPLSVLYVLQYGAVRQAVDEMKRRQTVSAAVERY